MRPVTGPAQHRRALPLPSGGRWRLLLVLGLLAGLFGMHALSPGGAMPGAAHHAPGHGPRTAMSGDAPRTAMTATPAMDGTSAQVGSSAVAASALVDESACHGGADGGGHLHHADATCASGAVGGGPVLPVPVPDPVAVALPADAGHRSVAASPDSGRAPPSLAELQLLRI